MEVFHFLDHHNSRNSGQDLVQVGMYPDCLTVWWPQIASRHKIGTANQVATPPSQEATDLSVVAIPMA
jgi:hypothetical protein